MSGRKSKAEFSLLPGSAAVQLGLRVHGSEECCWHGCPLEGGDLGRVAQECVDSSPCVPFYQIVLLQVLGKRGPGDHFPTCGVFHTIMQDTCLIKACS